MSLFGIDIGSKNIVVAALNRNNVYESIGCDVLINDNSNRLTPTLMSFKGSKRYIGDSADQIINNNAKNTISSVKHFLGNQLSEKHVHDFSDYCLSPNIRDGVAYYNLEYRGQSVEFLSIQVLSQYLLKSKMTIDHNFDGIQDYRISVAVPSYYDYLQIESVVSAAKIVNLNVVDIVFENTAISTCYYIDNIKRMKLLKHPELVMFVDIGHSAATVTITKYINNNIQIISSKSDISLGGILIDRFIVNHLSHLFAEKYSIDPTKNPKSKIKLFRAAERCKQNLNPENVEKIPVMIDCLCEDYDFSSIVERSIIENAITTNQFKERLTNLIYDSFNLANIAYEDLRSVEIIGGTMRIPFLKNILKDILNNKFELSSTLNMDECISKGCVYYSLFRRFSKEPINIQDYNNIDISSMKLVANFNTLQHFQMQLDNQDNENKLKSDLINQIEQLIINTKKRINEVKPEKHRQFETMLSYQEEWLHSDECEKINSQNLSEKYNTLSSEIKSYFQSGYLGGAVCIDHSPSGPPLKSKSGTGNNQNIQMKKRDISSQKHMSESNDDISNNKQSNGNSIYDNNQNQNFINPYNECQQSVSNPPHVEVNGQLYNRSIFDKPPSQPQIPEYQNPYGHIPRQHQANMESKDSPFQTNYQQPQTNNSHHFPTLNQTQYNTDRYHNQNETTSSDYGRFPSNPRSVRNGSTGNYQSDSNQNPTHNQPYGYNSNGHRNIPYH